MIDNERPVLEEDRASRVSFGDWTLEALTPAFLRAQYLIAVCGVRPELAAILGAAVFGEIGHD